LIDEKHVDHPIAQGIRLAHSNPKPRQNLDSHRLTGPRTETGFDALKHMERPTTSRTFRNAAKNKICAFFWRGSGTRKASLQVTATCVMQRAAIFDTNPAVTK
jgi:hypothetical protein